MPTSLFFGLLPLKMGERATNNEKKQRLEHAVEVVNPAENNRKQTEAWEMGKAGGIVLRGDATSNAVAALHQTLGPFFSSFAFNDFPYFFS